MQRHFRSRRLAATAGARGSGRAGGALRHGVGPARNDAGAARQASHTCLVMTGSGDPAFVRNFNPYTATSLPSGAFVQGAFYEPLIITASKAASSRRRGWPSRGNGRTATKTLQLNIVKNAKWSDGSR